MQESGSGTFLVDGFPRKLDQLEEFEAKVSENVACNIAILHAMHGLKHDWEEPMRTMNLSHADQAMRRCFSVYRAR